MNILRFLKMKFELEALSEYRSLNFIGNKIRGAMGKSIVRLFYEKKGFSFFDCENDMEGVYRKVFKPPLLRNDFTTTPAPFVIDVSNLDRVIKKDEKTSFSICLFGDRIQFFKEIILTVSDIFSQTNNLFNQSFKLLKVYSSIYNSFLWENGDFTNDPLATVWTDNGILEYKEENDTNIELMIEFKSALLLKDDLEKSLDFSSFVDMTFYRLAGMIDLYEEKECVLPYSLLFRKPYIQTEIIRKDDKPKIRFYGKLGRYLPYIDIGSHLHLGKKSTYGFGEYRYYLR